MFKTITEDLQKTLKSNLPQIRFLLKKNPGMAYKEIGEIGKKVGKKYNIELSFFHGRGGSAGRGGGPIQATLRSQPPGSV